MPPKKRGAAPTKKAQTLSDLIDPGSDGEEVDVQEKAPPKRKAAPKKTAAAKPPARGRKKLEAETEPESGEDKEGDAEEEEEIVEKPKVVKKAPAKSRARAVKKVDEDKEEEEPKSKPTRGRKRTEPEPEPEPEPEEEQEEEERTEEEEEAPLPPPKAKAAAAKKAPAAKKPPAERKKRLTKKEQEALAAAEKEAAEKETAEKEDGGREIAETQLDAMDVDSRDDNDAIGEMEIAPTPTQVHTKPPPKKPTARGRGKKADAVDEVAETQQVEDEEDDLAGGPVLGRGKKVNGNGKAYNDLERKYQSLEQRFTKLKDLKESEAEKSLARFKKNMDERAESADKLIASLQDDLNAQSSLAGESKTLKKKLQTKETEITKLQAKVNELNKNIQDHQKENQILSAKLAAAQTQKNVPGSAVKAGPVGRGIIPTGRQVSGSDDTWALRAKEALYEDLSGLIIMNIKKEAEGKLFECVQTGTNGALQFKLSVPDPKDPNTKTKNSKPPSSQGENKEEDDERGEDEYVFIPVLNEERDKFVISLLPEYLRDEIAFNKDHAPRFYQKINGVLTQKIPSGDEETEEETEDDEDDKAEVEVEGDSTMVD